MNLPDDIKWEEATSARGRKYSIGHRPTEGTVTSDLTANVAGQVPFGITVRWSPSADDETSWKETVEDLKIRGAISRYALYGVDEDDAYYFLLWITNTRPYNYHFHDAGGDGYEINAQVNSDYYIRYYTDHPTILYISGH